MDPPPYSRRRCSSATTVSTVFTTTSTTTTLSQPSPTSSCSAVEDFLPSMFRQLLATVPGLIFSTSSYPSSSSSSPLSPSSSSACSPSSPSSSRSSPPPLLSRHAHTRDIHSALVAAAHGRQADRTKRLRMGKKTRDGRQREKGNGNGRKSKIVTARGDGSALVSTGEYDDEDGHEEGGLDSDLNLRTQPRDVDALLARMMTAAFDRRERFPNIGNEILWQEVGRNVDWLEGMPPGAVAELGVEVFNARIEHLRWVKVGLRLARKERNSSEGVEGREKKGIDGSKLSKKKDGRTARVVDAWVEWREFMFRRRTRRVTTWRDHFEYDNEIYTPIVKDIGEGYQSDNEECSERRKANIQRNPRVDKDAVC